MRKFIVNVNGSSYEVAVEEIEAGSVAVPTSAPAPVAAAPAPAAEPVAAPAQAAVASGAQENIEAPMPGNIIDVKVNVGDTVKSGGTLLVLEAMKMENEILASRDCKIVAINVMKGHSVNSGDVLCVIE